MRGSPNRRRRSGISPTLSRGSPRMFRRFRLHHALFALGLLLAVAVSGPAAASIGVAGKGEPQFTNSETNSAWLAWTKPQADGVLAYFARLSYYHGVTGATGPIGATGTTGPLGPSGGDAGSGELGIPVIPAPAPLVEGHRYGVCALGTSALLAPPDAFADDASGTCEDQDVSGRRTYSIIDRTRPSIQVTVNGGTALTRASIIPVRIDYTDNLAFPFPANFVCLRGGIDPATAKAQCDAAPVASPQYVYDSKCSSPTVAPGDPSSFINSFLCNVAAGAATPDGPVTFCAVSADAAIPDNPASSNQSQTADRANLSFSACGSTVLDRTPPSVVVVAAAGARIGEALSVSSLGQDATSGLAGDVAWGWGDGSPASAGAKVTHVFTKTGTYAVTAAMADAAGNIGRGTASIVVTTGRATVQRVRGGRWRTTQLTSAAIIRRAGAGGHAKRLAAGDLQGLVPGQLRLKQSGSGIPVSLAAGRTGSVSMTYSIGGRRFATGGFTLTKAGTGTFTLALSRRTPAGKGQLLIRWSPAGGTRVNVVLDVTTLKARPLRRARKKAAKAAAATPSRFATPYVTGAPAGLPALP